MKSLLITGGTGDLGHAVVPRLLRDYRCVVAYRSAEAWTKLRDSAASDRLAGIDDLARLDGPLYGIVLLAGAFTMGSSEVDFATMLDANLMATVHAVTAALPHLEDGGRIVAISSAATLTQPAGMAAYVASKSALNAYLEVLAHEGHEERSGPERSGVRTDRAERGTAPRRAAERAGHPIRRPGHAARIRSSTASTISRSSKGSRSVPTTW